MKRKKLMSFLAVLMVWLLVASSALALTVDGNDVFADGEDMTVTGDGAGNNKATTASKPEGESFGTGYNIYGGKKDADVDGDTSVTIGDGAVVGDVYGGGKNGDVDGNTNVVIEDDAETGDVYGGGQNGDVDGNTNVVIKDDAETGDVYGGGHAEGEDEGSSYSNGHDAHANVTGDANVTVNGGSTRDVYGGGNAEGGDANAKYSLGGDADANVKGDANVTVNGGNTGSVHGGGKSDSGERVHKKSISGGTATAKVDGTSVEVNGGKVDGDVYGGGKTTDGKSNVKNDANVKVSGGTITGDVYGGGSSTNGGLALTGNDTQVTIAGGTVEGAVYGSGDGILTTYVDGESRIIIEGGKIVSGNVYASHLNTRIDLKDTSAFYYTYYVRPYCEDFQILNDILQEYPLEKTGCACGYWIYQFQGVSEPRNIEVVFQYTYNGTVIETVTKTVTVEFFQTAEKGRGVTVGSSYLGNELYKPASGSATVYFNSEQVTVPVELERYPSDDDDDDDDDNIPLNPGFVPGAEDIPLGVPSTGGLTDWSMLIAALGFAGIITVREMRRKKS